MFFNIPLFLAISSYKYISCVSLICYVVILVAILISKEPPPLVYLIKILSLYQLNILIILAF